MKNKSWFYITIVLTILFIAGSVWFKIYQENVLVEQFYGALLGVVITAIITVLLLQGQTSNEEKRDRSLKIFEKKQDVYHEFLESLKDIIKDGEITISTRGETQDELKDLLFQLGYIQMHTSDENTRKIFEKVSNIIRQMNDFNVSEEYKQKHLPEFYASLSEHLFEIISILKSDLYNEKTQTIPKTQVQQLLNDCDLFIENEGVDKHALQKYFWDELQKQFKEKEYDLEYKDFTKDISEYYARAKARHRYYGIEIPIYTTQANEVIKLSIDIENDYCYGIKKVYSDETNKKIDAILNELSNGFRVLDTERHRNRTKWIGYKNSDRYNLDFWKLDSKSFKRLANPRKNESLIIDIVDEIEMYISRFEELATESNL